MQRRSSLCAALLLALVSPALSEAKPPPAPPARFLPTPKGYGKPFAPPPVALYPVADGLLHCKTAALDECVVHGMPLIDQTDPAILPPLAEFLKKYAKNGRVSHLDGTASGTPGEYAQGMLDFACYDAAMTAIITAALADRSKDIVPTGRTRAFDEMKAANGLSQVENRFLWKNETEFEYEQHIVTDGKPTQAYHFPEVVADVSGGIKESCDPYTYDACDNLEVVGKESPARASRQFTPFSMALTNAYIEARMREGKLILVGFIRFHPSASLGANGVLTVSFVQDTLHKVPFAGYQPGAWPLTIADVGDGRMHRVRIGNEIKDLKFAPTDGSDPGKVKSVKFVMPPNVSESGAPFLLYEGGADQAGPNPEVYFIENYDYLFVPNVNAP